MSGCQLEITALDVILELMEVIACNIEKTGGLRTLEFGDRKTKWKEYWETIYPLVIPNCDDFLEQAQKSDRPGAKKIDSFISGAFHFFILFYVEHLYNLQPTKYDDQYIASILTNTGLRFPIDQIVQSIVMDSPEKAEAARERFSTGLVAITRRILETRQPLYISLGVEVIRRNGNRPFP